MNQQHLINEIKSLGQYLIDNADYFVGCADHEECRFGFKLTCKIVAEGGVVLAPEIHLGDQFYIHPNEC